MPLKWLILPGLLSLGACAAMPPAPDETRTLLDDELEQHFPALQVTNERGDHPLEHMIPEGPLGPTALQQLALLGSPDIEVSLAGLGLAHAARQQRSLLQNPGFHIEALRPEDGGRWNTEFELRIGVLDWLTRPMRRELAEEAWHEARLEVWQSLRQELHAVQQAYYAAVATEQRLALQNGVLEAYRVSADFAHELYEAGNLSELAWLRHESAAAARANSREQAASEAEQARYRLNRLVGLPIDTELNLPERLPHPVDESPDRLALQQTARQQRPDLALLQQSMGIQDQERVLQQRQGILPGLQVGFILEQEFSGERHPGLGLGMELPLFDRNQARIAGIDAQSEQLQARMMAQLLDIDREIAEALRRMEQQRNIIQQLESEDLPRYERMLELSLREYNFMLSGTFDLLHIRQQALELQLSRVAALEGYWLARAELDQASGNALSRQAGAEQPDYVHQTPGRDEAGQEHESDHNHDHGHEQEHHDHNQEQEHNHDQEQEQEQEQEHNHDHHHHEQQEHSHDQ